MRSLGIVGGGVVGLAIAWRAAEAGWSVTVFDPDPGRGASWVAGGMLAPLSEGWPGEEQALEFGAASLARWPDFAERLETVTDTSVFAADGVLTVALDTADAADLRTIAEWVSRQGFELWLLDRAGVREIEPALSRGARLGLFAPEELAVDNRALITALLRAAVAAGVEFVAKEVTSVGTLRFDQIVVSAGHTSPTVWAGLPVRPVKGEILRLRARAGTTPPPEKVVRARVHGRSVYLVPRADGVVVGATQYEAADTHVTVAGVRDLIADAEALMPGIGEYELYEAIAGLRPMTPDNLPLIGRVSDRVVVATGHGRNGILTTPLTVDAVLAELRGDHLAEAKHARPDRFPGGKR
ncbi:glycine oxidase ThiO [Aldersonia sp. NBC_00410]|uniref:glycine oxidase ThiO n=1 Tax=Aldersonia sp. NBC_00410 TaxID=2975954 RepID=UPI00224D8C13|nr:glycine oxidase ThiO [Aldersonia sp. NBC_00410]MCX5041951.1 glycine oxidase ThiO [Aldersonia sp. NBC_00410]